MFSNFKKGINRFFSVVDLKFNPKVRLVVINGIKICFIFILFATFLMSLYSTTHSYILYDLGLGLFKAFTIFVAIFFICGIAFNKLMDYRSS